VRVLVACRSLSFGGRVISTSPKSIPTSRPIRVPSRRSFAKSQTSRSCRNVRRRLRYHDGRTNSPTLPDSYRMIFDAWAIRMSLSQKMSFLDLNFQLRENTDSLLGIQRYRNPLGQTRMKIGMQIPRGRPVCTVYPTTKTFLLVHTAE